jgi:hypothetical protein
MASPLSILLNRKEAPMPVQKKKYARPGRAARKKVVSISDPEFLARFERAKRVWQRKLRPLADGARSSERLSERDLAIRINARG